MSQTTKKTIRFYSKEESKVLAPYINKKQKIDVQVIKDFCKKYDRKIENVISYIYSNRMKLKSKRKMYRKNNPTAKLKTKDSTINLSKNEFNIPIKNWSITQHTDGFYFNVKF